MLAYLSTLLGLSPEMLNLAMMALTLAVSIAHMRGNELPALSMLLRLLGGKPVGPAPVPEPKPEDPAKPAPQLGDGHLLRQLILKLDKLLAAQDKA